MIISIFIFTMIEIIHAFFSIILIYFILMRLEQYVSEINDKYNLFYRFKKLNHLVKIFWVILL